MKLTDYVDLQTTKSQVVDGSKAAACTVLLLSVNQGILFITGGNSP